jgi:uncharacterized protein YcbK (DUF882 family)
VRAAVVLAVVAALAGTVHADAYVSKKDRYLLDKQSHAEHADPGPAPAVGKPPAKLVNLYNSWTHEWLAVDAKQPKISADLANRFLRCHFTNEPTQIDAKLLVTAVAAARKFESSIVRVVSGFRHPKYNLMLRKKGRQVARDSQHSHGQAIDFWLPGISVNQLHRWAKQQAMGGVGIYRGSGFVHMDVGPIRYWSGD